MSVPREALVGADLGGTNFRVGVRLRDEVRLLDQESCPADPGWDAAAVLDRMEQMLALILARRGGGVRVAAVGFGATGDIDFRAGICYSMKRFPGLEEAPLRGLLQERFGCPAAILNDGLCAALGELRAGAGRGVDDFVMVTLGTGIGGGVVVGGRLLTGAHGRVGKVGHQIIDLDGPVHCHCGLPGCWQSHAGKGAVLARARAAAAEAPGSALAELLHRSLEPDLARVTELAEAGDRPALHVVRETGRFVGIGLANLVKIFAPQRLIVGGGLARPLLLQTARDTVAAYAIKPYQHVPLIPAELGPEAGLLGATLLPETLNPEPCP